MSSGAKVRYMRLIVFFDLPVKTAKQRKDYRQFRKFLLKDGYLQLQESVYAKLVVNDGAAVLRWLVCARMGHLQGLFRS